MIFTLDEQEQQAQTTGGQTFLYSFVMENCLVATSGTPQVDVEIPASFLRGLADCEAGRVVDMERAMNEPPPPPPQSH